MEKYAIIKLAGKQYKVKEGLEIKLERQEKLDIDVILFSDGKTTKIGDPLVKGVDVKATIIGEERAPKIEVRRFRNKSRYRKNKGHRQPMSVIRIESIGAKTEAKKVPAKKATPKKTPTKKATAKKTTTKSTKVTKKVAKK